MTVVLEKPPRRLQFNRIALATARRLDHAASRLRRNRENGPKKAAISTLVTVTDFGDDFAPARCRSRANRVFRDHGIEPSQIDRVEAHDVDRYDIAQGSFVIAELADEVEPGSVFVGVIDPGVGTRRASVIVQTNQGNFFVGPDNGLSHFLIEREGLDRLWKIDGSLFPGSSETFHGLDIFTPVGAAIASGDNPGKFGTQLGHRALIRLTQEELDNRVLRIDHTFGNVKVHGNIPKGAQTLALGTSLHGTINVPVGRTFGDVAIGEPVAYEGSNGTLEMGINQGDFAHTFGIQPRTNLHIEWITQK